MSDDEFHAALEEAIRRTGVARYRFLCSDANLLPPPNSAEDWRRHVREIAGRPAHEFPSLPAMAVNLAGALWDWAVSGFEMASEEEQARRLAICGPCPFHDDGRCRHLGCGCFLAAKVKLKTQHCPISKW